MKKSSKKKQKIKITKRVLIILFLAILLMIFCICLYTKNQILEKQEQNTQSVYVPAQPTKLPIVSQIPTKAKEGTKTYQLVPYVNNEVGFSVLIPQQIYFDGGGCQMVGGSYRPKNQWAPTKIFQDGEKFFITTEYVYALLGAHDKDGITYFSDCEKQVNTLQKVEKRSTLGVEQEILPFFVGNVTDEGQITAFLQRNIWNNYKLGKLIVVPDKEYQKVELDLVHPNENVGQGATQIFYYPKKGKIVAWSLGQYNHYLDPDYSTASYNPDYVQQMIDSFKFN